MRFKRSGGGLKKKWNAQMSVPLRLTTFSSILLLKIMLRNRFKSNILNTNVDLY